MQRAREQGGAATMHGLGLLVMDEPTRDEALTVPMQAGGGLCNTWMIAGQLHAEYHWPAREWARLPDAGRPVGAQRCGCGCGGWSAVVPMEAQGRPPG